MALLIVEQDGKIAAGVISGRVVIGRRPQEQVRAADNRVSRIHAWIEVGEDGTHCIVDAGSRTGTFVNDERVELRRQIGFGDQIRIGPLLLRIADGQSIPNGATSIDLSQRMTPPPSPATGISFDCTCGAPIWAPWEAAGKFGQCKVCNVLVAVPRQTARAPIAAKRQVAPPVAMRLCGICHGAIQPTEEITACPACGATFHVECWSENGGCSVYGCSEVAATQLPQAPNDSEREDSLTAEHDDGVGDGTTSTAAGDPAHAPPHAGMPVAYALLALSVLAAVAGALTFGATAFLSAMGALLYLLWRKPRQQRGIVFLSIGVSVIGAAAGAVVSYYWWLGRKL